MTSQSRTMRTCAENQRGKNAKSGPAHKVWRPVQQKLAKEHKPDLDQKPEIGTANLKLGLMCGEHGATACMGAGDMTVVEGDLEGKVQAMRSLQCRHTIKSAEFTCQHPRAFYIFVDQSIPAAIKCTVELQNTHACARIQPWAQQPRIVARSTACRAACHIDMLLFFLQGTPLNAP